MILKIYNYDKSIYRTIIGGLFLEKCLQDTIRAFLWRRPHLDNFEANLAKEILPLSFSSLHPCIEAHHGQVQHCNVSGCLRLRNNHFVDVKLRVSRLHCRNHISQDLFTLIIGPIVQNVVIKISSGSYDFVNVVLRMKYWNIWIVVNTHLLQAGE